MILSISALSNKIGRNFFYFFGTVFAGIFFVVVWHTICYSVQISCQNEFFGLGKTFFYLAQFLLVGGQPH